MANPRAEGDKLLEGAGPAVLTSRFPSTVARQCRDKSVPIPLRGLKAKLTLAMEVQNLEDETRPQHYRPYPPSCTMPQFPQRNSILLGCPPCSSTKTLTRGCTTTGQGDCQQTDPGRDVYYSPSHPLPPARAAQCMATITVNTKCFGGRAELALPRARLGGLGSTQARLRPGGAGTCCLNVNTSFIHLDWLSSAMLRYT